MKVLLLTCNTGEGHNSAAKALREEFINRGDECEIKNALNFKGRYSDYFSSHSYSWVVRCIPRLYHLIFPIAHAYDRSGIPSPVLLSNSSYGKRLNHYIREKKFDAVIAVHLFPAEVLSYIRKKFGGPTKYYFLQTDYGYTPFAGEPVLDGYFIPSESNHAGFVRHHIDEAKIHMTGIPVSSVFRKEVSRAQARAVLGIPENPASKVVVVSLGGTTPSKVRSICADLLRRSDDTEIYVMLGKNEQLKETLDKRFADEPRLRTVAFTDKIYLYMRAADVLIAKPGGLTCTEVAVFGEPVIYTTPIPSGEMDNADFFTERGMALYEPRIGRVAGEAEEFLRVPEIGERMVAHQAEFEHRNSAAEIADVVDSENEAR
jgi:processive 1,2-diacylglycerol beta-glucosyltransferase